MRVRYEDEVIAEVTHFDQGFENIQAEPIKHGDIDKLYRIFKNNEKVQAFDRNYLILNIVDRTHYLTKTA
jgi:hypothetical protein